MTQNGRANLWRLLHLGAHEAQALVAVPALAVLRLDLLALIAVVVIVVNFADLFRIFGRVGVVQRVFCHGVYSYAQQSVANLALNQ